MNLIFCVIRTKLDWGKKKLDLYVIGINERNEGAIHSQFDVCRVGETEGEY